LTIFFDNFLMYDVLLSQQWRHNLVSSSLRCLQQLKLPSSNHPKTTRSSSMPSFQLSLSPSWCATFWSVCMSRSHVKCVWVVDATPCNTLQHPATPCNTLKHPATPCNTLFNCRWVLLDVPTLWQVCVWRDFSEYVCMYAYKYRGVHMKIFHA
jgi:hypothetical protein